MAEAGGSAGLSRVRHHRFAGDRSEALEAHGNARRLSRSEGRRGRQQRLRVRNRAGWEHESSTLPFRGGSLHPERRRRERHLKSGGAKQTVKWKAGGILGPPLNAWRQHFNRGSVPVRLLAI